MPRDYKKEYKEYHGSSVQKKRRALRNKANRHLRPGEGKEVDHKIPLSKGGGNGKSNWRVVTRSCNRKKYNKKLEKNSIFVGEEAVLGGLLGAGIAGEGNRLLGGALGAGTASALGWALLPYATQPLVHNIANKKVKDRLEAMDKDPNVGVVGSLIGRSKAVYDVATGSIAPKVTSKNIRDGVIDSYARSLPLTLGAAALAGLGVRSGLFKTSKLAQAIMSQEDIYSDLLSRIPKGTHHVSGGLPDARGTSDVDIYLPTKDHSNLLGNMPKGTTVTKSKADKTIYTIPGYDREVNLYATMDPHKEESIHHRATMLALAKKYPELAAQAFKVKAGGKGSEPAWAEVLGLKGDPYEVMTDTRKVLTHAAKRTTKKAAALYRPRGTIFVTDGKGNIYAGKQGVDSTMGATSPYYFPGGGLLPEGVKRAPTKKEVLQGMRQEALEELGLKLKRLKVLAEKPVRMDMPEWWVARNFKKRGVEYKGLDEYYGHARAGNQDMSQYNSEGDAFQGRYYPIETVSKALRAHASKGGEYSRGNERQADLLSKLSSPLPPRLTRMQIALIRRAARIQSASNDLLARTAMGTPDNDVYNDLRQAVQESRIDHPTQRLLERSNLPVRKIQYLREAIKANASNIPRGNQHVLLEDGSKAVIKDVGRQHVLATILHRNMARVPGEDLQFLNKSASWAGIGRTIAQKGGAGVRAAKSIGGAVGGAGVRAAKSIGGAVGGAGVRAAKSIGGAAKSTGGFGLGAVGRQSVRGLKGIASEAKSGYGAGVRAAKSIGGAAKSIGGAGVRAATSIAGAARRAGKSFHAGGARVKQTVQRSAEKVRQGGQKVKQKVTAYTTGRHTAPTESAVGRGSSFMNPQWVQNVDNRVASGVSSALTGGTAKNITGEAKAVLDKGFHYAEAAPGRLKGVKDFYGKNVAPIMSSRAANVAAGTGGAYGTYATANNPNANIATKLISLGALAKGGGGLLTRGISSGVRNAGQHWKGVAAAGGKGGTGASIATKADSPVYNFVANQVGAATTPGSIQNMGWKGGKKLLGVGATGATVYGGGKVFAGQK